MDGGVDADVRDGCVGSSGFSDGTFSSVDGDCVMRLGLMVADMFFF